MAASRNNRHIVLVASVFSLLWVHLIPKGEKKIQQNFLSCLSTSCLRILFVCFVKTEKKSIVDAAVFSQQMMQLSPFLLVISLKGIFLKDGKACLQSSSVSISSYAVKLENQVYWKAMLMTPFFLIFYLWISSQSWPFGNIWQLYVIDFTPFFFLKIFPNLLWKKEKEFDVIYYKGKVTFKFFQSKLLFPALNPCRGVRHPLFYQLSLLPPTFLFLFIFNGTSSDLSSIHSWDTYLQVLKFM